MSKINVHYDLPDDELKFENSQLLFSKKKHTNETKQAKKNKQAIQTTLDKINKEAKELEKHSKYSWSKKFSTRKKQVDTDLKVLKTLIAQLDEQKDN